MGSSRLGLVNVILRIGNNRVSQFNKYVELLSRTLIRG